MFRTVVLQLANKNKLKPHKLLHKLYKKEDNWLYVLQDATIWVDQNPGKSKAELLAFVEQTHGPSARILQMRAKKLEKEQAILRPRAILSPGYGDRANYPEILTDAKAWLKLYPNAKRIGLIEYIEEKYGSPTVALEKEIKVQDEVVTKEKRQEAERLKLGILPHRINPPNCEKCWEELRFVCVCGLDEIIQTNDAPTFPVKFSKFNAFHQFDTAKFGRDIQNKRARLYMEQLRAQEKAAQAKYGEISDDSDDDDYILNDNDDSSDEEEWESDMEDDVVDDNDNNDDLNEDNKLKLSPTKTSPKKPVPSRVNLRMMNPPRKPRKPKPKKPSPADIDPRSPYGAATPVVPTILTAAIGARAALRMLTQQQSYTLSDTPLAQAAAVAALNPNRYGSPEEPWAADQKVALARVPQRRPYPRAKGNASKS